MAREDLLFYGQGDFRSLLESLKEGLKQEVHRLDRDRILKVNEDELCTYLYSRRIMMPSGLSSVKRYIRYTAINETKKAKKGSPVINMVP